MMERVKHPSHYNKGIETIDYIESWDMNFNVGNVIKYVTRAKYKGNEVEDLKKALWYLEREIENIEHPKKKFGKLRKWLDDMVKFECVENEFLPTMDELDWLDGCKLEREGK